MLLKKVKSKTMEAKKVNDDTIEQITKDVLEKAKRLGLTHEIHDLVNDVKTMHEVLSKKSMELNALEALAWESDDENITELRNQLLAATKLVYSDLVADVVAKRDMIVPDFGIWEDEDDTVFIPKKSKSLPDIFLKMRNKIRDYNKVKDIVKEVRRKTSRSV